MKQIFDTLPIFEPNQVLTSRHLNLLVDYLDEQGRLTRANLIGTGIACGLELMVDDQSGTVALSRGCAVTSEGFLLVEPADLQLTRYRRYELPDSDLYPPLMVPGGQTPLTIWELCPDGEADTTATADTPNFLSSLAFLLFLELDADDLSDCSPNNCDNKGIERHATVRKLAISQGDVGRYLVSSERMDAERARRQLPDVAMPRYDVPNSEPGSSREVLEGFQRAVARAAVVSGLARALSAAYLAYRPLLCKDFPENPFESFQARFRFMEALPGNPTQVLFLQYYYDLMRDLIAAYDEFRWRALDLRCECCGANSDHQRHVLLGRKHRHHWTPAAAACCDCAPAHEDLRLLFRRLVEMTRRFTDRPSLPGLNHKQRFDTQIKITPSRYGEVPLSGKAIPYYYELTGQPPLYELWNPLLRRRNRANRNLGYRARDYQPSAPPEVLSPLAYDLEPYNFFRIEGHLGKDYRRVLATIEHLRLRQRLPFDVIALHTGALSDEPDVAPGDHKCSFRDLEALYASLRAELLCMTEKALGDFGRLKLKDSQTATGTATSRRAVLRSDSTESKLRLNLDALRAELFAAPGTVGLLFADRAATAGFDDLPIANAQPKLNFILQGMNLLIRFRAILEPALHDMNWDAFAALWRRLKTLSEEIAQGRGDDDANGLTWAELSRKVAAVVYACRIEALVALRDEYRRRVHELHALRFFANYATRHPSLQHGAGVCRGGTFILVVHGAENEDTKGMGAVTKGRELPRPSGIRPTSVRDPYEGTLAELADGTVIADLFLPYICASDCPAVQYNILPLPELPPAGDPPVLFAEAGCTGSKHTAPVALRVSGGKPPHTISVDGAPPQEFSDSILLTTGTHVLQVIDVQGAQSAPIAVTVAQRLEIGEVAFTDDVASRTYTASLSVRGGTPPYGSSEGRIDEDRVDIGPIQSGESVAVKIFDAKKCEVSATFEHVVDTGCDKPCDGQALRVHYPVWFQVRGRQPFHFTGFPQAELEIRDEKAKVLFAEDLRPHFSGLMISGVNAADYDRLMLRVAAAISKAVQDKLGPEHFVIAYDKKEPGTFSIEYYKCHSFQLRVGFTAAMDDINVSEDWTYSNDKLMVTRNKPKSSSYSIPPLGAVPIDRCRHTEGAECRVPVLSINPAQLDDRVVLSASFGRGVDTASLRYHWRVETPALLATSDPEVGIPKKGVSTIRFQLAVMDRSRCWGFAAGEFSATRTTRLRITPRDD